MPVLPSQLLLMSLWIWLALDVGNLEGVSLIRVHDHVFYLPGCSCHCSHPSQRQSVVILSAISFENHRKHHTDHREVTSCVLYSRETRSLASHECSCGVAHVRRGVIDLRHCIGLRCFQGAKLIFQLWVFWWKLLCPVVVQNCSRKALDGEDKSHVVVAAAAV